MPVALLLPLSGESARLGRNLLDAAQMALFDTASNSFQLMPYDTRGTPGGAKDAALSAVEDGARLLLGPIFARSVTKVALVARNAGLNVVAFSNSRSVAAPGIYLLGMLPRQQIDRIVGFARVRGLTRIAALVPDTAFGRLVVEETRQAAFRHGAILSRIVFYAADAHDVAKAARRLANYDARRGRLVHEKNTLKARRDEASRAAIRRLERRETLGGLPFDAVLLPEGGARLKAIAPHLPFYDIDPAKIQLLGTAEWSDAGPGLGREPALVGGWYPAPPPEARTGFERRYLAAYGRRPHRLASLAYDATALAAILARADKGPDFGAKALTSPTGFAGTDGIFRFLPTGRVQRALAVLRVEPWGTSVIGPAPESFAAGGE